MKYKNVELDEITTPQVFDPPQMLLVWWWWDDVKQPEEKLVSAIINTNSGIRAITYDLQSYPHCAEIPKHRRATNRELAKWLIMQRGEYKDQIGLVSISFTYDEEAADTAVCDHLKVRTWDDAKWHEPTVDYMEIKE